METIQPILKRGRDVWDQINMPEKEFKLRINNLRDYMAEKGISVALVFGSGVDNCGDICYLTNFSTKMNVSAILILPLKEEPTLFFEGPSRELKTGARITWVEDIRSSLSGSFSSSGSLAKDCLNFLNEKHLIPSKIGVSGVKRLMPFHEYRTLMEGLKGCEIIDIDEIFIELRMKKTEKEIDQIRRASRTICNTLSFVMDLILDKVNERIFEAKLDWFARIQGAEDVRILLANSKDSNWALRPADDRIIQSGEEITLYLATSFERYWADIIRTFSLKDSKFLEVKDEKINKLYRNIIDSIKLGTSISDFYNETLRRIEEDGYIYIPDYSLGNGIGLSLEESPFINKSNEGQFLSNMCFSFRLTVKDNMNRYIMLGDTLLIKESVPEILTKNP